MIDKAKLAELATLSPSVLIDLGNASTEEEKVEDNDALWNQFLIPDFQTGSDESYGNAKAIYLKHPECRLYRYVGNDDVQGIKWEEFQIIALNLRIPWFWLDETVDLALLGKHPHVEVTKFRNIARAILSGMVTVEMHELSLFYAFSRLSDLIISGKIPRERISTEQDVEILEEARPFIETGAIDAAERNVYIKSRSYHLAYVQPVIEVGFPDMEEHSQFQSKLYYVSALIIHRVVTSWEEVNAIPASALPLIRAMSDYIIAGVTTLDDVLQLKKVDVTRRQGLVNIKNLLLQRKISVEQAVVCSDKEFKRMCLLAPQIEHDLLTLEEALLLTDEDAFQMACIIPELLAGIEKIDALSNNPRLQFNASLRQMQERPAALSRLIREGWLLSQACSELTPYEYANLYALANYPDEITREDVELSRRAARLYEAERLRQLHRYQHVFLIKVQREVAQKREGASFRPLLAGIERLTPDNAQDYPRIKAIFDRVFKEMNAQKEAKYFKPFKPLFACACQLREYINKAGTAMLPEHRRPFKKEHLREPLLTHSWFQNYKAHLYWSLNVKLAKKRVITDDFRGCLPQLSLFTPLYDKYDYLDNCLRFITEPFTLLSPLLYIYHALMDMAIMFHLVKCKPARKDEINPFLKLALALVMPIAFLVRFVEGALLLMIRPIMTAIKGFKPVTQPRFLYNEYEHYGAEGLLDDVPVWEKSSTNAY